MPVSRRKSVGKSKKSKTPRVSKRSPKKVMKVMKVRKSPKVKKSKKVTKVRKSPKKAKKSKKVAKKVYRFKRPEEDLLTYVKNHKCVNKRRIPKTIDVEEYDVIVFDQNDKVIAIYNPGENLIDFFEVDETPCDDNPIELDIDLVF